MSFKRSLLALTVGALCSTGAVEAANSAESIKPLDGKNTRKNYTFYLPVDSNNDTYQTIESAQSSLLKRILAADPEASVVAKAKLLSNFVTVQTTAEFEGQEAQYGVAQIRRTFDGQRVQVPTNASVAVQADDEIVVAPMTPYLDDEEAGAGASVAIISTGIDYTLQFFGGSGELGDDSDPETPPTPGSYLDALENGAIEFSGFPTDVVVGGWDFSSENFGNDANPIDQHFEYESWNGWVYPTGMGTKLASIVHQLAPGADLYAYKVTNVTDSYGSGASFDKIVAALEHALDPNQDGDTSDHVDIALLDGEGAAAFFDLDGVSTMSLVQHIIEKASGYGMTIVADAGDAAEYSVYGDAEESHRYWISGEGGATSTITVGSVTQMEDATSVAAWSPKGPVRGSLALKPEIVSFGSEQPVALITPTDATAEQVETNFSAESGGVIAAARIAAAAAVVKGKYGTVGPAEIKAILANTASNNGITEVDAMTEAELISVGHGLENLEAATSTPVFAWDATSLQPYLQFGNHEVADTKTVVKSLVLRNMSDSAQTYFLTHSSFGEAERFAGVTINYPSSVSIPAMGRTEIIVTIDVDASALNDWPLNATADFTDENLKQVELNGYLTLTSENNPTLNVGWMVKARPATTIDKSVVTEDYPKYLGFDPDTYETQWEHLAWVESEFPADEWGNANYTGYVSSFVNESKTATEFHAYPVIINKQNVPTQETDLKGHFVKTVGGGVYSDAQCSITGKKFVLAVQFALPANVSLANYWDKIQDRLFFYDLYHEAVVAENGWDEGYSDGYIWDDTKKFNQPFVSINTQGQPVTYLIDYNQEYDWANPNGRFVESSLPVLFNSEGTNVVSQFCLEDAFHHEIDSIDDFDQNLGIHIETDRYSGRNKGEPIAQFNPVQLGYYKSEEVCDDWGWCYEQVTDTRVRAGFAVKDGEIATKDLNFSPTIVAQAGEEVVVVGVSSAAQGVGIGSTTLEDKSLNQFMVISVNDNFGQIGYVGYLDEDGTIIPNVRREQTFVVNENAESGVVGKIKFDTQGFFAYPETEWESLDMSVIGVTPGTPFMVNSDFELVLVNPDALDYEVNPVVQFNVVTRQGNNIGTPRLVTVRLENDNDVAPAQTMMELPTEVETSGAFNLDIANAFSDAEGDMLTFTVSSSAVSDLTIDGSIISGKVTSTGNYSVTVMVSDGVNQSEFDLTVNLSGTIVLPEPEKEESSGGAFHFLMLSAFGLLLRRRKK